MLPLFLQIAQINDVYDVYGTGGHRVLLNLNVPQVRPRSSTEGVMAGHN